MATICDRIGQDVYQTYARTRVEREFFSCPFLPQKRENKQKMPRNGTYFLRAKARLRTTLVIFPSDGMENNPPGAFLCDWFCGSLMGLAAWNFRSFSKLRDACVGELRLS